MMYFIKIAEVFLTTNKWKENLSSTYSWKNRKILSITFLFPHQIWEIESRICNKKLKSHCTSSDSNTSSSTCRLRLMFILYVCVCWVCVWIYGQKTFVRTQNISQLVWQATTEKNWYYEQASDAVTRMQFTRFKQQKKCETTANLCWIILLIFFFILFILFCLCVFWTENQRIYMQYLQLTLLQSSQEYIAQNSTGNDEHLNMNFKDKRSEL